MSSQSTSSLVVPITDEGLVGGDEPCVSSINPNRWFFDKSRLENTPSRRSGIDSDKELSYRQQAANFIQDIGQRLQVNQLCINTAIVYMHRFFMYHSFTHFHRNSISTASIFLAAKVEEQPRKLDHVIKVSHYCLHREQPAIDPKSDAYQEQSAELVMNENILLQTLGFDVAIDHPHTHVVKCCQLVRASKDLAQTSYFMATNRYRLERSDYQLCLHLTTMCLQYKPTVVACVCIHLACKWSSWEIPRSKEGKDWWMYVDDTVTADQLELLTTEFLIIFNKSPSRLKRKIISLNAATGGSTMGLLNVPGIASLSGDSTNTSGQPASSANRSHSRSPSPKRPRVGKPGESHTGMMAPSKAHPGQMALHHGMKPPANHHGAPPPSGNKLPHPSMKQIHPTKASHPGSAKDHHPQFNIKDPHHPHYQQQQAAKNPFPGQGHHPPGQYPHGSSRPNVPNAQVHHSHSSQGHGLQGQKPPAPGSSASSSAHHPPYPTSVGSSAPKPAPSKPLNTSQTNPSHLSQPNTLHQSNSSHLNHQSAPIFNQNQNPAVSKNINPNHPHAKKPYEAICLTRTDYVKREGQSALGAQQLQQPRPRSSDKPDNRHQQQQLLSSNHQNQVHSNSSSKADSKYPVPLLPFTSLDKVGPSTGNPAGKMDLSIKVKEEVRGSRGGNSVGAEPKRGPPLHSFGNNSFGSMTGMSVTSGPSVSINSTGLGPVPTMRTTSLFSPDFKEEEESPSLAIPSVPSSTMIKVECSVDGNDNIGGPTTIPPLMIRPNDVLVTESKMFEEEKESHKHKKKKKEKHKHKEKHKEKKEHKKERHKEKHKHKDRSPHPDPVHQNIKIKLTINKGDKGGVQLGSSNKNSNLRQ